MVEKCEWKYSTHTLWGNFLLTSERHSKHRLGTGTARHRLGTALAQPSVLADPTQHFWWAMLIQHGWPLALSRLSTCFETEKKKWNVKKRRSNLLKRCDNFVNFLFQRKCQGKIVKKKDHSFWKIGQIWTVTHLFRFGAREWLWLQLHRQSSPPLNASQPSLWEEMKAHTGPRFPEVLKWKLRCMAGMISIRHRLPSWNQQTAATPCVLLPFYLIPLYHHRLCNWLGISEDRIDAKLIIFIIFLSIFCTDQSSFSMSQVIWYRQATITLQANKNQRTANHMSWQFAQLFVGLKVIVIAKRRLDKWRN